MLHCQPAGLQAECRPVKVGHYDKCAEVCIITKYAHNDNNYDIDNE